MFKLKKSIVILSIIASLGIAIVSLSDISAASTNQTDTIEVTIVNNCELSYGSTAHSDGDGAWGSSTTANTLSATRVNGSITNSLGSTAFSVTCNDSGGSQVILAATSLASGDDFIDFSGSAPNSSISSWGINDGTSWLSSGDSVWSSESPVSGSTFSVTYGLGLSATQSAGTYTGVATYTLAHPYAPPSPKIITFSDAFAKAKATKDVTTGLYKMQDMTSGICAEVTTATTVGDEEATQLVDLRDNTIYVVAKMLDDHCWMATDLKLQNYVLDDADSDVIENGVGDGFSLPASNDNWSSTTSSANVYYDTAYATDGNGDGAFYNYYAASAGSAADMTQTETTASICPKGWTIPTGSDSGQFQKLFDAYGYKTSSSQAASALRQSPFSLGLNGIHSSSGALVAYRGTYGGFWTSSSTSHPTGQEGTMSSSTDIGFGVGDRSNGYPLRCIAK